MATRCNLIMLCLACAALSAGCATEKPAALQPTLPESFANAAGAQGQWPAQDWYRGFSSDELNSLVELAAKNNWDLAGARARVLQADARARQAGAAILPSLDGTGTANYLAGHSKQGSGHEFDWSAMLSASYEVDFWGKNRAALKAALLLTDASRADRDTVSLTTFAGVANGYFQVLALRERLALAQSTRDAVQQVFDVVKARFDAGLASPVEVASQKAALDTAQIAITDLQPMESEALAALALLIGRLPEGFDIQTKPLDSLTEPVVAPGLPSELLTRRPDVVQAESNLRAGHADLVAARAAMFPNLSLTAGAGLQNPALPATVLTIPGVGPSFSLGANLVQPIFDHGRLRAQRDEVLAKETELMSVYRTAIISAFTDVENALSAIHRLEEARQFESDNVAQSERAYEGAKLRYQSGSGDFLTLLDSQQILFVARDKFVQAKLAHMQALVALCKALGGGWTQPTAAGA